MYSDLAAWPEFGFAGKSFLWARPQVTILDAMDHSPRRIIAASAVPWLGFLSRSRASAALPFKPRRRFAAPAPGLHRQRGEREQNLRAALRGDVGGVVVRSNLHHIAADHVEPVAAAKNGERLARGETADFWRPRARRKAGIEAVDVEAHIGRPVAKHRARFRDHRVHAHGRKLLGMDDGHAGI